MDPVDGEVSANAAKLTDSESSRRNVFLQLAPCIDQ